MRLPDLARINRRSIQAAGPRYMPGQDRNAPNFQIASITEVFDALGMNADFRAAVQGRGSRIRNEWRDSPEAFRASLGRLAYSPERLLTNVNALGVATPRDAGAAAEAVKQCARAVNRIAQRRLVRLDAALSSAPPNSEAYRALQSDGYRVRRFMTAVRSVIAFTETPSFHVIATNRLSMLGRWGTGKTHSLCDITERRMSRRLPTLLCLGQQLPDGVDPLEGICRLTGLATRPDRLLRGLQRLGARENCRALLIVDAINEGDRKAWKLALAGVRRQIDQYPNVGLVLSCRQPFDEHIFSRRTARQFVTIYHEGFAEREFDAQLSFFDYYDIPAPHFPLIADEFSRPLFLKLVCESLEDLSHRNQHRQLRQFASGQRGMTFLLERFVKHVGASIEDDFHVQRGLCWRILKGDPATTGGPVVGIAPSMAAQLSDTLTEPECLQLVGMFLPGPHIRRTARQLLRRMLSDGLLSEDIRWTADGSMPVIRFPYQRFGDHIIARHLLSQHLNTDSEASIRRSFYGNRPLGRIFEVGPHANTYRMPGLASALMVEFPERVQRRLPQDERELLYYLPRNRWLLLPLKDAFLESLPWRSDGSFTRQTDEVVGTLLSDLDDYRKNDVIEVLVGLATREGHAYSAQRIQRWLSNKTMIERDLVWSEYIRRAEDTSIVYRLIVWVERNAPTRISEAAAAASARLLSLFLTSTVRPLT